MNEVELTEAKKVFTSLPFSSIRIDEKSLFARIGRRYTGKKKLGVTIFRTVNFTQKLNTNQEDLAWLIHELVHVAQMQAIGSQYIFEALKAQRTEGYDYGGIENLQGKKLSDFNLEQQGDIIRDAYNNQVAGSKEDGFIYQSYIEDLQANVF